MLSNILIKKEKELSIPTLNDEDFFIHLCTHLYKEATTLPWVQMRRDMTLYKFSDIYLLMSQFSDSDVRQLFDQAKEMMKKMMGSMKGGKGSGMAAGFDIKPTQSAICAVMLYDAKLSQDFANRMAEEGIYVTGFYYPVVPKDQARIRVQLSAAHSREDLDKAIAAFTKVGKELGVIK